MRVLALGLPFQRLNPWLRLLERGAENRTGREPPTVLAGRWRSSPAVAALAAVLAARTQVESAAVGEKPQHIVTSENETSSAGRDHDGVARGLRLQEQLGETIDAVRRPIFVGDCHVLKALACALNGRGIGFWRGISADGRPSVMPGPSDRETHKLSDTHCVLFIQEPCGQKAAGGCSSRERAARKNATDLRGTTGSPSSCPQRVFASAIRDVRESLHVGESFRPPLSAFQTRGRLSYKAWWEDHVLSDQRISAVAIAVMAALALVGFILLTALMMP
jgi:hypothetical protein